MLSDSTLTNLRIWLNFRFGISFDGSELDGGARVTRHRLPLADYHGVYVWQMDGTTLISVPDDMQDDIRGAMDKALARYVTGPDDEAQREAAYIDEAFWRMALGERVERIVGPAYQGFCDVWSFQSSDTRGARPLTLADHSALRAFIAACPADDWQDSAIAVDHLPLFGLERDGALVALASAPVDRTNMVGIRSVGVVTLPAARGTGAGLAVVSALVGHLFADAHTLIHYQTLRANLPSVAIARRLGFEDVATTLAVRLR